LTSVVAPVIILLTRRRWSWQALTAPAIVILPVFVLVHGALTVWMDVADRSAGLDLILHGFLLALAVLFWLPVLGPASRLSIPARCVYLFLSAPALDLAGVIVVARGDSAGGLAMIVAMLPIGFAAVGLTWKWMRDEERAAVLAEAGAGGGSWPTRQ
jgi:cytochrome c oxidase assembly factor CtaG